MEDSIYTYNKSTLVQPSRDLPPTDDLELDDDYKNQMLEEELYNASIINKKAQEIKSNINDSVFSTKKKVSIIKKPKATISDIINSNIINSNITKTIFPVEVKKSTIRQFNPRLPLPTHNNSTNNTVLVNNIDTFPVLKKN